TGQVHIYKLNADGTIAYSNKVIAPEPYLVVGENQLYAENNVVLTSATKGWQGTVTMTNQKPHSIAATPYWDVYFRSEVHQPGTTSGGKHAGEPMDSNRTAYKSAVKALAWSGDYGEGGTGCEWHWGHH